MIGIDPLKASLNIQRFENNTINEANEDEEMDTVTAKKSPQKQQKEEQEQLDKDIQEFLRENDIKMTWLKENGKS